MPDNLIYVGCNIVSTHREDSFNLRYRNLYANSLHGPISVYVNCVLGT